MEGSHETRINNLKKELKELDDKSSDDLDAPHTRNPYILWIKKWFHYYNIAKRENNNDYIGKYKELFNEFVNKEYIKTHRRIPTSLMNDISKKYNLGKYGPSVLIKDFHGDNNNIPNVVIMAETIQKNLDSNTLGRSKNKLKKAHRSKKAPRSKKAHRSKKAPLSKKAPRSKKTHRSKKSN